MNSERMKKIYFNCEITNQTGENTDAKYSVSLLKPIIDDPMKYNINVNRFRLPLNGVPLSKKNIPFQQWQVGLGFNTATAVSPTLPWVYKTAFVPQVNPKTAITNKTYNVNGQQIQRVNNDLQLSEILESGNIQNASSLKPAYDLQFGGVVYVVNTNLTQVDVFDIGDFSYITSLSAPASRIITCITSEPTTGKFFMAYADGAGENVYIQQYEHTAYATFTTSNIYSTNTLRPGSIYSMTFYSSKIYAIYQPTDGGTSPVAYLSVYQEGVGLPLVNNNWNYENSYITHNAPNNIIFVSVLAPNPIGQRILAYNPSAGPSYITSVGNFFSGITLSATNPFVGFDINNHIIIDSGSGIQVRGYTLPSSMPYLYGISFTNGSKLIFETTPAPGPVDSGDVEISHYQTYLSQINSAFEQAFTNLKNAQPLFTPTQAPRLIFNPQSKLFSIVCQGSYLESGAFQILMNLNLWNMFLFPSSSSTDDHVPSDSTGAFKIIIVQNNIYNAIYSSGGTTPSFVTINQESTSIFKFYDLVRILLVTSKIPVNGDCEGINSSVNLITDIVPDTSTLTPDDIIVYQPTVLRNYNLDSNVPLRDLDIAFYYGCKDGSIYKVQLLPNEYASIKLEFEQVVQ